MVTHARRPSGLLWLVAAVVGLMLFVPTRSVQAHNPLLGEFTCPLCHEGYTDIFLGPWPFYLLGAEPGVGPELRTWSYMGPGHYKFMACPHCGYCNAISGFNLVYRDLAETRKNPHAEPPAKPPGAKARTDSGRSYLRLFPAAPLDYPAIKAELARSVDPALFRYVNAYFPERLDIALRTVPGWTAHERFSLALTGAWSCDDSGETARGLDFRAQAIEHGRRLIQDFPPDMSEWNRLTVRYQVAEMQLRLGQVRKDPAMRAEGCRAMEEVLKRLAAFLREAAETEAGISSLRDRLRQRAKDAGVPQSKVPDPPETIKSKDAAIVGLVAEIRKMLDDPSLPCHFADMATDLEWQAHKELAADDLRDKSLEEALAAARKGTPIEREAFLMLHGWRYQDPPVKEFVQELLAPLCVGRGGSEPDTFWRRPAPAPPQLGQYLLAIAQSQKPYPSNELEHRIIRDLFPEEMEGRLPKVPSSLPARGGDEGAADHREGGGNPSDPMVWTKLVPANAGLIRRALATLADAKDAKGDTSPDQDTSGCIESLCRVDAAWMAEVILEDLSRRPRLYIWCHKNSYNFSEESWSAADWPRISPDRLIAKYLPDRARRGAREALERLAQGKGASEGAAAALGPLEWLEDAESLQILRDAAKSRELLVSQIARDALRGRNELWLVRLRLEEATRDPEAVPGDLGNLFLLDASDAPNLRKLVAAAQQKPEAAVRARDPRAAEKRENRLLWALAALAHVGDQDALRQYNALAFRVLAQVGDPVKDGAGKGDVKRYHTPVTARCADLEAMLQLAQRYYCTEAMAEELLKGVHLLPHWYTDADQSLLSALAANPRTHDHYRRLAANLAPRPTPLGLKTELMRHAAAIRVPEVTQAIRRWAESGDRELAREARSVLRDLDREP